MLLWLRGWTGILRDLGSVPSTSDFLPDLELNLSVPPFPTCKMGVVLSLQPHLLILQALWGRGLGSRAVSVRCLGPNLG